MKTRISTFATVMLILLPLAVFAQPYTVAVAQMPGYAESLEKGFLIDLVKAMNVASGTKITVELVPFARAMDLVQSGKADFQMPLIRNTTLDDNNLPYLYSTETIFHVNFVLYTNAANPIDKKKLSAYKIETDAAHTPYFPFPTIASFDLAGSIKKLQAGRIDGFIFADAAIDPIIKDLKFTDIKRELYYRYDVKITLPRNDNFAKTDAFLTATIKKLRASGEYDKIMAPIDAPFKP